MTKPFLKTLSLTFILAAAAAHSFAQVPLPGSRGESTAWMVGSHIARTEVERGWERQQRKLAERLAARAPEGVEVPGTIILPPFPSFAPYRTDVPPSVIAKKTVKPRPLAAEASMGAIGHE